MGVYTDQNHIYKPVAHEDGAAVPLNANWDKLDRPELLNVAATAWHIAATLGALLDDLYSRYYLLATTTVYDVVDGAGDTVLSAAGDTVIVRL